MSTEFAPRVRPRILWALAVFIVVQIVQTLLTADPKEDFGESIASFVFIIQIGAAALVSIAVITAFRWWRPVLSEPKGPPLGWLRILAIFPGLLGLGALIAIIGGGDAWGRQPAYLPAMIALTITVGISEELLWRGIAVIGGRADGWPEWLVWLVTTLGFASTHILNTGMDWETRWAQVVSAILSGSVLYLARRLSGTIIVPIILHALMDLSILGVTAKTASSPLVFGGGVTLQAGLVLGTIATIVLLIVEARRRRVQRAKAPENSELGFSSGR